MTDFIFDQTEFNQKWISAACLIGGTHARGRRQTKGTYNSTKQKKQHIT